MIVPITKLFRISADELLGINDVEADKRYEELRRAFDHIEEDTREWLGNEGTTLMQDFREYPEEPQFHGVLDADFLRTLKK